MDEYAAVNKEANRLIQERYEESRKQQEWRLDEAFKEANKLNFRYDNVETSHKIEFLEDMHHLIYDPKKEDMLKNGWKLAVFQQFAEEEIPQHASARKDDPHFGAVQLEGRVLFKAMHISYTQTYFNVRDRTVFFYDGETDLKETYRVDLNENTVGYAQENEQFFPLMAGDRLLKIKRDNDSKQLIRMVQNKVLELAFRGAYVFRNEVPDFKVQDFLKGDIDVIRSIDFVHQTHLGGIVKLAQYRNAVGGFLQLLTKFTQRRRLLSGQITYPQWLKPQIKTLFNVQVGFSTNFPPAKNPLMHLKIKLSDNAYQQFSRILKYVFPFYKSYSQRSLTVYESGLQDEEVKYLMNQVNYPMHTVAMPRNNLSVLGLEYLIAASSVLYHEVIDCSFNAKLMNINGGTVFKLCNVNPSIKKIVLKGCIVLPGKEEEFFQGFSTNLCLSQLEIDYLDSYNDAMIRNLENYNAEIL